MASPFKGIHAPAVEIFPEKGTGREGKGKGKGGKGREATKSIEGKSISISPTLAGKIFHFSR